MIVKTSKGFVNLANSTETRVYNDGTDAIRIFLYWNFTTDEGTAYDEYYGDDAQAIYDALDAAAEAERRKAQ